MSISVGSIEGTITLKDQYTATARNITAETLRIKAASDELSTSIGVPYKVAERAIKQSEGERTKLLNDYKRLASGLDPVTRKTHEYDRAVDTLTRSLKAGIITQEQYNLRLAQAQQRFNAAATSARSFGNTAGGIKSHLLSLVDPASLAIAGITAVAAVSLKLLKDTATASIEAEVSASKVESAVSRYGARAGVTAKDINDLAAAQSRLTGVDDELIAESAALALRFNRLSGDEIPRLVRVAQDMAEVTGMDLPAAMQKAGGYVNLPLQALTKLRREGYAVSAGQEKLIKDLLRAGDVAGAQAEIFKILEAQYQGAAEAARDTLAGALRAVDTEWENFLEDIGEGSALSVVMREGVESTNELIVTLRLLPGVIDQITGSQHALEKAFYASQIAVNKFVSGATKGFADLVDGLAKAGPVFGLMGLAIKGVNNVADVSKRLRAGAAAADRNAAEAATRLTGSLIGLSGAQKATKGTTDELTGSETKLSDAIDKAREAAEKALQASRDELADAQALLHARKLSTDAMKLEQNVQAALAKAQAAGKGATSAQRLEIIRNTLATLAAKEGIEDIADAQRRAADLFAVSNKEMLRQVEILVQLEAATRDLLSASIEVNAAQVDSGGAEATATTRARIDYAAEWRESWTTAREAATREIQRVMDSLLTVEEKERAIAQIRAQQLDEYLAQWGGFFDTLGSMFGGVFQQISNAINSIQQAIQAGNQAGGLLQGAGAGAWAGSLGAVFGTLAAIYEVYKAVDAQIEKNKRRKWGDVASVEVVNGQWSQEAFSKDRSGQEVSAAIGNLIRDIVGSIGGVLDDLPQITIRARRDGKEFSAYVAGIWVGTFRDAQTAVEEGVRYAVTHADFAALSIEFVQALKKSMDASMDELRANLDTARTVRRARIGDTGADYVEISDRRLQEIDAARRLGLSIDDLIRARREEVDALKYQTLGIDTSVSNLIESLRSLDAGMMEAGQTARAALETQIAEMRRQLEYAQRQSGVGRRGTGEGGLGGPSGSGDGPGEAIYDFSVAVDENTERLRTSLAAAEAELAKIPEGLSAIEVEIGVFGALDKYIKDNRKYEEDRVRLAKAKVEIEFALIRAQLAMWGKLEQFAGLLDDAYARAMEMAEEETRNSGRRHGGGGGAGAGGAGGDRESARTFLRDRRFDLALSQLDEYARRVAEVSREYDIQIAQAGKDKKLREELIALKDQELAQMADEQRRTTSHRFEEFMGLVTQFDQARETASDLIKEIEASPFGDARKARMIGRVMGELDKQLERLSRQEALDLFGSMIGDLEKYGATEEMMLEARKAAALLEHTLNLENYRVRIAALEAEGKLAPEVLAKLKAAFNYLEGIDPTQFVGGGGAGGVGTANLDREGSDYERQLADGYKSMFRTTEGFTDAANDMAEALKNAQESLQRYKDKGISPFQLAIRDATREFEAIRAALGDTPEIAGEFAKEIERIKEEFSEPLNDYYDELTFGDSSRIPIDEQLQNSLSAWEKVSSALRGGDLSQSDEYVSGAQRTLDLLSKIDGSTSAGFGGLKDRIETELRSVLAVPGGGSVSAASLGALATSRDSQSINTQMTQPIVDSLGLHGARNEQRLDLVIGRLDNLIDVTSSNRGPGTGAFSIGN